MRQSLDPRVRFRGEEVVRDGLAYNDAHRLCDQWNLDAPEGRGWRLKYTVRYNARLQFYVVSKRARARTEPADAVR